MKTLPRILPRSSLVDGAPLTVRSSPPSRGGDVTPTAVTAGGVGGASSGVGGAKVIAMAALPQRHQGAPLPLVILPQGYQAPSTPQAPPPPQATPTSVLHKAKRPLEATAVGGASPLKRKRGRPRKTRKDEEVPPPAVQATPTQPPIITSLSGGVIQKASSSSVPAPSSGSAPLLLLSGLPPLPPDGGAESRGRPLLLGWVGGGGSGARTPMVEVIQKAPPTQQVEQQVEMTLVELPAPPPQTTASGEGEGEGGASGSTSSSSNRGLH